MSRRSPIDIIHEIAAGVPLAKNSDKTFLERLSALFEELERELSTGDQSLRECVVGCRSRLSKIVEGRSNDVDADITMITRALNVMYQTARRKATSRSDSESVSSSHSSGGGFILPDDIDEETFRGIVSSLKTLLGEIEEELVEEVVADFLERDRSSAEETATSDRFHTIRREARLLGFLDLELVCIAAEEYMEAVIPGVERANRLLAAKDWIARALDSYSVSKFPEAPYTKIVASLDEHIMANSGGATDDGA